MGESSWQMFAAQKCGAQTVYLDTQTGWGESVFKALKTLAPPPSTWSCARNLPDPEKSKSASSTGVTDKGGAGKAPRPLQPSSPSWGLRPWVSASATTVHTAAEGARWLPRRGQFSKQRPPWCHRLHQVAPPSVGRAKVRSRSRVFSPGRIASWGRAAVLTTTAPSAPGRSREGAGPPPPPPPPPPPSPPPPPPSSPRLAGGRAGGRTAARAASSRRSRASLSPGVARPAARRRSSRWASTNRSAVGRRSTP